MLGSLVTLYLFLGGCGAGVLLVGSLWSLQFCRVRDRGPREATAFDAMTGRLYLAGAVMLVVAALCLLLDLGMPQRFLLLFLRPTFSLLSVGSFILLGGLLCACFLVFARFFTHVTVPAALCRVVEAACAVLALLLMGYTGVYLAWMEAVPLWNNLALPVLFVLSSASSGIAVALMAIPFGRDWKLLRHGTGTLRRIHGIVLTLELVAVVLFVVLAAFNRFAQPSLAVLLGPTELGPWFIVGFFGAGVVVPLGAEIAARVLHADAPWFAPEVLCVFGGLILRFCLVLAGSHWLG